MFGKAYQDKSDLKKLNAFYRTFFKNLRIKGNKTLVIHNPSPYDTSLDFTLIHLISLSFIVGIDSSINYFGANSYGVVHKPAIATKPQQNTLLPNSLAHTNVQLFLTHVTAVLPI